MAENNWQISIDTPAVCAYKLKNKEANVGIVPAAFTLQLPQHNIITNYGIAADGAVNSVFIFSNTPIEDVKTIYLDYQSYTSNALCRILCREYWGINPNYNPRTNDLPTLQDTEAMVLIGDRTFSEIPNHAYVYDLSDAWKSHTGLPFVFAVWCADDSINASEIAKLESALEYGNAHLNKVLNNINPSDYPNFDYKDYLQNKIKYQLTDDMKKGLALFLEKLR